jgi:thiamine biosynthesis lipoprotein
MRLFLATVLVFAGCSLGGNEQSQTSNFVSTSQVAMTTKIDVLLPETARHHAEKVYDTFAHVDATANEWKEEAMLAKVNRQAGIQPVVLSEELMGLVSRGLALGEVTGGAFDVTWAAMWGTWDFVTPKPPPDVALLAEKVALVDYRKVEVHQEKQTVYLPMKGMKLGLGGIAKGYALDGAAAKLRAAGVEDFTITAGGQVYAGGNRGDRPWRIGIRDPRGEPDDYFGIVSLSDTSISTSGDYERFFVKDGVRYHHILDPKTGQPARKLRSVTIISPDATLADALSTALMVMGKTSGMALVSRLNNVEAVLVDNAGEVHMSPGVDFTLVHQPIR